MPRRKEKLTVVPEVVLTSKSSLLKAFRATRSKPHVASLLGVSITDLNGIIATFEQDSPGFMNLLTDAKDYREALAKQRTFEALENGDVRVAQWELERTTKEYNPKLDITSDNQPISGFKLTPPPMP